MSEQINVQNELLIAAAIFLDAIHQVQERSPVKFGFVSTE
jgi:hypothetical protein